MNIERVSQAKKNSTSLEKHRAFTHKSHHKKLDLKLRVEKHEDVKYFSCIFHSSEIKLIGDFDG